jgi:DNA-directed RNA polymerase subunit M/transcription elongation factor TFIIS
MARVNVITLAGISVDKQHAENLFVMGGLHPICPNCECGTLKTVQFAIKRADGNNWRPYQCTKCGTRFRATIEV